MIQILRDRELDTEKIPEKLKAASAPGSFTVWEDDLEKGRLYFSENGEELKIEKMLFSRDEDKKMFSDGLIKALLNFALLKGKKLVVCEREDLFQELFLAGFLRGNPPNKLFASPEEFFSKKTCDGCKG